MLVFAQITKNKMADAQEFLSGFGEFLRFYIIFCYISMESLRKCKNNDHTCLFQCIIISRVYRKLFEPEALSTANVNA